MSDKAQEIIDLYEEAAGHFKRAVVLFALSIAASLGAIFYIWRKSV